MPMAVVTASAAAMAAHHGQSRGPASSSAATTPPRPDTKPIDRSISPSSSTNTSAMPSVAIHAAWVIRLTRLPAERNSELRAWK